MLKKNLIALSIASIISGCGGGDVKTSDVTNYKSPSGNGNSPSAIHYNGKDIYLNGANIAWLSFASDFGSGLNDSRTQQVLDQIKSAGGNSARWWVHANGTMSPIWNPEKSAIASGSQDQVIADIKLALDIAESKDMYLLLNLWSFDMLAISQKGVADIVEANHSILTDTAARESYIQNFIYPLLDAVAGHPALVGIDLFNEPENMTESWFIKRETLPTKYQVELNDIHLTTAILSAAIHDYSEQLKKEVLVTTGPKSLGMFNTDGFGGQNYYSDSNMINLGGNKAPLDYYAPHYYDDLGKDGAWSPFYHQSSYWELDKPIIIAEFFADNDADKPAEFDYFKDPISEAELCLRVKENHYAGAFSWQWGQDTYRQSTLDCISAAAGKEIEEPASKLTFESPKHLAQVSVKSDLGNTNLMTLSSEQVKNDANALKINLDEPIGEKKVYVTFTTDMVEKITEIKAWVYYPKALQDSGINGGKWFAKDANWVWSEGPWYNIPADEWTLVSWTLDKPLAGANELGFQLYGDKSGAASNNSFFVDDVMISD